MGLYHKKHKQDSTSSSTNRTSERKKDEKGRHTCQEDDEKAV
jgi:hypothetical protein